MVFSPAIPVVQNDIFAIQLGRQKRRYAPQCVRPVGGGEDMQHIVSPSSGKEEYSINYASHDGPDQWEAGDGGRQVGIKGEKGKFHTGMLADVVPQPVGLHRLSADDAHGGR